MTIRPARPGDRPAMERICARTWEWGDYIPDVWDHWLTDEQGLLIVSELEGRVVALSRIRFQAPDQIWLEGMRVDPEYRRRGIGRQFLDHSIAFARERGACVVRLSTSYHNVPVHTLAAQAGMVYVAAYQLRSADALPTGPDPAFLSAEHADRVRAFLSDSPMLAYAHGLYSDDWAWQEMSPARIDQFLEAGQFAARLAPDGRLAALAVLHPQPEDSELWIGYIDGEAAAITELATAVRGHAARFGAEKVQVMVPDLGWLRGTLSEAGYGTGEWEGELWVFERWLSGRAPEPAGDPATPSHVGGDRDS
jgi:GNAT superfamily N-acetyltransferase